MKRVLLSCVLIVSGLVTKAQGSLQTYIDSVAHNYLLKAPGSVLMIGVNIQGEETIFSYGATENGQKPDPNSLFEIGQITQVFTNALFASMSIKGEINPDDPISKYLPMDVFSPVYQEIVCEPVKQIEYQSDQGYVLNRNYTLYVCKPDRSSQPQPILLCYLTTHTSGLPSRPYNLETNKKDPYANYTKEKLYEFMRGYSLPKPIGFDFKYSDLNTALLGHIMELKSGKTFEELLDSVLLSKLEMSGTKIKLSENERKYLVSGHTSRGKIAPYWNFNIMAPCGGLHSNLNDMMKFLSANITTVSSDLKNVLDYTHNVRLRFNNKKYGQTEAGLGWLINPLQKEDKKYVWQEGVTGGFASFIGFVESSRTGVVVLSSNSKPVSGMACQILQKIN